jgi:hypothetical protein
MPNDAPRPPKSPALARVSRDLAAAARAVGGVFEALVPRWPHRDHALARAERLAALAGGLERAAAERAPDLRTSGDGPAASRPARAGGSDGGPAAQAFEEAYALSRSALDVLRLAAVAAARTEEVERARVRELGARTRQLLEQIHLVASDHAASVADLGALGLRLRVLDVQRVEGDALLGEL